MASVPELMTPWQTLKALWRWIFGRKPEAPVPEPTPPKIEHIIRSKQIVAGRVIIMNTSTHNIRLEGPVLRSLFIKAGEMITVQSPVLEPVWRIKSVVMEPVTADKLGAAKVQSVDKEIAFVNEWDALEVIDNMIEEHVRSRAYDLMTPSQLQQCKLPLEKSDPVMQEIYAQIGLTAQRENENVSAQA